MRQRPSSSTNTGQSQRSLPNAPEVLNLRVLHDAMKPLATFLSGVSSVLQERLECVLQEHE